MRILIIRSDSCLVVHENYCQTIEEIGPLTFIKNINNYTIIVLAVDTFKSENLLSTISLLELLNPRRDVYFVASSKLEEDYSSVLSYFNMTDGTNFYNVGDVIIFANKLLKKEASCCILS